MSFLFTLSSLAYGSSFHKSLRTITRLASQQLKPLLKDKALARNQRLTTSIRNFSFNKKKNSAAYTLSILADIEGERKKIETAEALSSVFSIEDHKLNFKRECDKFVFLGDSIDKGKSSIEVLKFLVEFAEENPERVTLILGNRDINKLRFLEELKDESLDLSSSGSFRIPSWEHEFNNFPHELNGKKNKYTHGANPSKDKALKMKFLFAKTLGSPKAFQDFKEELEQLISKGIYPEFSHIKKISDEDVPGLYMEIFLNPEKGLLTRYLRLAKMVYYDTDKKTLITHGFLTKENFLQVPGRKKSQSLNDWLHDLNTWGSEGVEAAFAGEKERALDLITYQEPKVIEGHWVGPQDNSVIQGRPWTDLYDISSPTKEVLRTLQLEDVSIVASGHSPVGDVPVVVKDGGVEFIMLDTSATKPPRNASVEINEENESDIRSFLSFSKDELQLFEYGSAYSGRSGIRTEEGHWILGNLNGEEISVSFKKNPYGRWGQASYKIG